MVKKISWIFKRVIMAFVFIYSLNVLVSSISIFIPINLFSIGVVSLLDIPGLVSLLCLFFIMK